MKWYFAVLKNYARFSGRASRTEFWMFQLVNLIISVVFSRWLIGTYFTASGPATSTLWRYSSRCSLSSFVDSTTAGNVVRWC